MRTVYFIYADGCEKCMAMREILLSLQYDLNKETKYFDIVEMECDTDAAVDYAVDNGIDEIPAVKIDNLVIQGEDVRLEFTGMKLLRLEIEMRLKSARKWTSTLIY